MVKAMGKGGFGAGSKAMGGPGKKPMAPATVMPGGGAAAGAAFKKGGPVKKGDKKKGK